LTGGCATQPCRSTSTGLARWPVDAIPEYLENLHDPQ
jgi:hypothetical protein